MPQPILQNSVMYATYGPQCTYSRCRATAVPDPAQLLKGSSQFTTSSSGSSFMMFHWAKSVAPRAWLCEHCKMVLSILTAFRRRGLSRLPRSACHFPARLNAVDTQRPNTCSRSSTIVRCCVDPRLEVISFHRKGWVRYDRMVRCRMMPVKVPRGSLAQMSLLGRIVF